METIPHISKKVIHFSDLHIGYMNLDKRFECIMAELIFAKEPASQYVIVFTGDLVETATDKNYKKVKRYFERLERKGFTVLAVPGNHDYGNGVSGSEKYVRPFKELFFGNPDLQYPKLDIIDNIAFIGLDSMAEELHWYNSLFAEGELGEEQLQRLDAILNDDQVKNCACKVIYLHHHPFDPVPLHYLKDSRGLARVVRKHEINALLYGHNHMGRISNGKWGVPRCYDAGTTTRKHNLWGYHRVIDFNRDPRWDYDANFCGFYA